MRPFSCRPEPEPCSCVHPLLRFEDDLAACFAHSPTTDACRSCSSKRTNEAEPDRHGRVFFAWWLPTVGHSRCELLNVVPAKVYLSAARFTLRAVFRS